MSADKKSTIKCQAIEHIRGYGNPKRWNISFSKDHGIAVVNCSSDCLYIYDKDSKKRGTLKFPDLCHFHDLITYQGSLFLICGLKDGRIFSCSLQQWCHQKKKHKNKSKSKRKAESDTEHLHQELNKQKEEKEKLDGDDDIFKDLLGGGGDGSTSAIRDESHNQFQEFLQTVGSVTMVDEQKMMLHTSNLEGMVMVNDCLVKCCREGIGWRISVHSCQINKITMNSISCDKNPLYSTMIFGVDDDDASHLGPPSRTLSSTQCITNASDEGMEDAFCVGVYGLVSSSSHSDTNIKMQSCSILVTSDFLFDAMWGSEANLVDSPVVLISLPDGCVYTIRLKSFHPTSFSSSSAKAIRLLCQSLEPVHHVCTVRYSSQSNPAGSGLDCLVLVGTGGQLLTFYADPMNRNCTEISKLHTSAPISAAESTKDTLMCASNFDLNFINFHLKDGALQITVCNSSMPGISAMALLKGTSSCYKLLAVKRNGTVLQLSLPSDPTTDTEKSSISSVAAKQRVQEALRNMKEVSSKMAALTRLGSKQRVILEELSTAHHIVCQSWENSDAFQLESRVECTFENGQNRTKVLCKVTNCTSWTLSHGWTLIGTLLGDCSERSKVKGSKYHRTKSIPLFRFAPKANVTFSFVLDESRTSISWPLTVDCSLCFDLSVLMNDDLPKEQSSQVLEGSVTLDDELKGAVFAIGSSVVDALDSLQLRGYSGVGIQQGYDRTRAVFSGFPYQSSHQESPATHDQVDSLTIQLDRNLLRRLTEASDSTTSPLEHILHQLLPSNKSVEVKDLCIDAVTPCGCLVSIQALEHDPDVISLQVTSSDLKVTRALVEAIHARIKNSKLSSAKFSVDKERMNKVASIVESHLDKLLSISDQLTEDKSREDLVILIKELMDLHRNMRCQITLY